MKIKSLTKKGDWLTEGKEYAILSDNEISYVFIGDRGWEVTVLKKYFEIVEVKAMCLVNVMYLTKGVEYPILSSDDYNYTVFNDEKLKQSYDKRFFEIVDNNEKEVHIDGIPEYYDNSNGTLYKVADERKWNAYVTDSVKRLERAEKKGEFFSDIRKTIKVLELYMKEQGHKFGNEKIK